MKRRAFLDTGPAMLGSVVIAGYAGDATQDDEDSQSIGSGFPSYDVPPYGEWIPHEIIIDGTRVHATATFEEEPDVLA